MSDFTVNVLLRAQVEELKAKLKSAGGAVEELGNRGSRASKKMAKSNKELADTSRLAARNVSQIGYQFNDIAVMMMAGQNPIQLAVQQGTQLNQVLGPMGAAGAVRSLGSALVAMFNPMSIITIGSIAAGAAMVQWLTGASEEAETLEDQLGNLAASVDNYVKSAKLARSSDADLADEFGSAADEARVLMENMANLNRATSLEKLRDLAASLASEFGGLSATKLVFDGGVMTEIEATMFNLRDTLRISKKDASALVLALRDVEMAVKPEQILSAMAGLSGILVQLYDDADNIPAKLKEIIATAKEVANAGGKILAADGASARVAAEMLQSLTQENSIRDLILRHAGTGDFVLEDAAFG